MDVFPRMLGTEGISISWLYTSTTATTYRVYKFDLAVTFAEDDTAQLLREVVLSTADCGLTYRPDDFRDTTTGSEPGLEVGYAIVPLDQEGGTLTQLTGKASANGFIVAWFGDIVVDMVAQGGGPVEDVTVKLSHMVDNKIDGRYEEFLEEKTDPYGQAVLKVRVQDKAWTDLTQHFRVTVEKISEKSETAPYVQKDSLNVSGASDPRADGTYAPILDD